MINQYYYTHNSLIRKFSVLRRGRG
jgi:hypothetical protein